MDRLVVDKVYLDKETKEEEELLLVKKLNELLSKVKPRWERVVVYVCLEERNVLNKRRGQ